jgi:cell wall-associated NlpC family hydrolase
MVVGAIALAVLSGCTSSTPRFRSETASASHESDAENESRHADRIRQEVSREDDRAVDPEKVRKRLSRPAEASGVYSNRTPEGLNRDQLLLGIIGFLGVPYEYGGMSRNGIDCSGFTALVYKDGARQTLPRSARAQYEIGTAVNQGDLQFGDLVFFNTTGQVPSHVGIYVEDDLFAHASVTQGVTFSSLESTYYRKRFVGARRVVE